jgi:hypothetical protein
MDGGDERELGILENLGVSVIGEAPKSANQV